jgi:hypothetical protein
VIDESGSGRYADVSGSVPFSQSRKATLALTGDRKTGGILPRHGREAPKSR